MADSLVAASYRDPAGFLFCRENRLFRQVNRAYREQYDLLMSSGLYDSLVADKFLIAHAEVSIPARYPEIAYKVIQPERLAFISYPYEWCFSQLKDAALLTLRVQKRAFERGMTLKDARACNVQFSGSRPVFIDSLSFEIYRPHHPWVAYRQFCRHFLAPLALMSFCDARLAQLLKDYSDGIPLDFAARLLPFSCRLRPGVLMHVYLHAAAEHFAVRGKQKPQRVYKIGRSAFGGLIESLESTVKSLRWEAPKTVWSGYYEDTTYSPRALKHKEEIVGDFLDTIHPDNVWDLGANTGIFSRCAARRNIPVVAFDSDLAVVERSYRDAAARNDIFLLPLVMDVTNPSPALGWDGKERMSLRERGPARMVFALALVHHLVITHNLPFSRVAGFLHSIGTHLAIEFVPDDDSQARLLLGRKGEAAAGYTREAFEADFGIHFIIQRQCPIIDSGRILYLMRGR